MLFLYYIICVTTFPTHRLHQHSTSKDIPARYLAARRTRLARTPGYIEHRELKADRNRYTQLVVLVTQPFALFASFTKIPQLLIFVFKQWFTNSVFSQVQTCLKNFTGYLFSSDFLTEKGISIEQKRTLKHAISPINKLLRSSINNHNTI